MLFGPQYDDDASDRIVDPTAAALKKKKGRSARNAAPRSSATNLNGASTPIRGGGSKRLTTPTKLGAMDLDSFYSNSTESTSSGASFNNYYANTAAMATQAKNRRRDASGYSGRVLDTPARKQIFLPADLSTMYSTVWKGLHFRKKTIPLATSTSVKPICVTGVDGFLGSWIVCELLSRGYRVRGTVQSRNDDISGILSLPNAKNFTVVETSLLTPEACDLAVLGCDFVIHTGTPTSCSVRDPISEQDEPGVHSIGSRMHCIIPMMTNFIQACARARIKRVVLTSSIAAMADAVAPNSIVNETSWNITSSLERNPHFLSLKLAEEAAWQLVDQLPREYRIDLVTINPGTLFGPSLSKSKLAPGNHIIFDLISGQYSALVDLNWSMVDVRDCALAHVAALENLEARGRYICVNRTVWMKEIVEILANNGFSGRDLPWRVGLPNWVARLPAYSAQLGQVGASLYANDPSNPRSSPYLNEKVIDNLNIQFESVKKTIVESANDLLRWGLIKPWAEDHESFECNICEIPFTFYRRRHHCRECGVIICSDCSKSRAVVEGTDGKVRLCDRCVKSSVPGLLEMLSEQNEVSQRKAVVAIEALMDNEDNHDYVTRYEGVARLMKALHSSNEVIASHAAGALVALSTNVSSALQMVLEGAVLQMLEVEETTTTWAICLQALRNLWKQVNRNDFRKMLHAVARVSTTTNKGDLQGNILLTFVHMMDPTEVPTLLSEGLLGVLFEMLQSESVFPRCAAAHAVKHLVPASYNPDLTIDVPPYLVDDHEELLANSSLSDLQFLVKGSIAPINAHKVVLFFRNSYFKNMVRFGSATSQTGMIEIDNCSYEVFSILLRFLYTGKVHITPNIAQELLRASSIYHVYELQKRAEHYLAGEIRVDNVVDLLTLAEECQATDLKRNCVPFLMRNIHEVVGLPAYRDHRIRTSDEVLKALASMLGEEWEESYNKLMQTIRDEKKDIKESSDRSSLMRGYSIESDSDMSKVYSGGLMPSFMHAPSSNVNSGGFTAVSNTDLPHLSDLYVDPAPHSSYMKPFGAGDVLFRRSRGLSEDFSEPLSEGVC
ncbi:hypothetical protein Poli38472_006382 [Pythium oligandrum]|uniref:Uncharacterized protein n=1 Tax=Pythium oligandrum TaxID=41045 RepID=A0A8K1FE87_PYTOL|nr:hypothetical protein Poli38472_006382 [Pythium oligandrum]|eukprot:TMW56372.1 hypothetical protein Poli38472_006382 [Pythium oligandrum]